jgi:DNA segregation ATPase FtsK/SpoIIIE, S-DNA-T family
LLYRLTPEQCRFIMIDPKMLELSVYDGIPHLLTPVVTDPRKAITALKWTVNEMNVRYERMCKVGVRNIQGYNQKVLAAKKTGAPLIRTVQTGFDEASGAAIYEHEDVSFDAMAHIVVVIDEMADLMLVAGKDIEYAVQRLSQMARAAGIHLIMATQRPSVDVITGTIKANFPSRISFQVTSKIDSRTILGEQGAEQLLGAGDMLFMASGGRIMRAHGPFVGDDEVEKVVNFLKAQGEPEYLDDVLAASDDDDEDDEGSGDEREPSGDDLYDQAVDIVLTDRKPTTSYLQRRLGVGYNRAASLIERMEEEGLLSPPNRTGKREILVGEQE